MKKLILVIVIASIISQNLNAAYTGCCPCVNQPIAGQVKTTFNPGPQLPK